MELFKNGVGRPSNEILRKRRIFSFSIILLVIFLLSILAYFLYKDEVKLKAASNVTTLKSNYKIGQFVYYDPIENKVCNSGSYWTIYNQDTTCYRWAVISTNQKIKTNEKGKSVTYNTTRLLLDHDMGVATYKELPIILKRVKDSWDNSNILQITNLGNQMVLKLYKSNFYELNKAWSMSKTNEEAYVKSLKAPNVGFLFANTRNYYGGKIYYDYSFDESNNTYIYNQNISTENHAGGYWITHSDTKDIFKEYDNYSYYMMPSGHIGLSDNNTKRGFRPTIYLKNSVLSEQSYIKTSSIKLEVSNKIADGLNSKAVISGHKHSQALSKSKYYYPQGFAFYGENKFYVYMMHRTLKENGKFYNDTNSSGVLLDYNKGFKSLGNYNSYHGNGLSYNNKTKEIYISTDEANNKRISKILPGGKLETVMYNEETALPYYSSLAFDEEGKYVYGIDGYRRIVVRNAEDYKVKYTFDSPILETLQGISYSNGYLYLVSYETPRKKGTCDYKYQLYCYNEPGTATIYIYNVKFNSDGTPTKLFGQLVKKIVNNNLNKNNKTNSYEVESIGVINDYIYLGFAKKQLKTNVVVPTAYKFKEKYNTISYYKDDMKIGEQKVLNGTYVSLDNDSLNSYDFNGFKSDISRTYKKNSIVKVNHDIKMTIINK